jgi:hypothetical protein
MNTEQRIRKEIDEHKSSVERQRKQLMLWNKDINKWTENIQNKTEKDISLRVKLIADQASEMVRLVNNIDELNNTIALKESLFASVEGFGDALP